MKKMLICCGVLCMTFLLFCGSALAADATITVTNDAVSVAKGATDGTYTVTRSSGVSDGQLYLVLILEGSDTTPKPTTENVYYMDVKSASGTSVSFDAYPKALNEAKTYTVFLSDYSQSGAAKAVATLAFAGGGSSSVLYGDVDGNGKVNGRDLTALAKYCAEWADYQPGGAKAINLENANCDGKGSVNSRDMRSLARHLAEWAEYAELPHA